MTENLTGKKVRKAGGIAHAARKKIVTAHPCMWYECMTKHAQLCTLQIERTVHPTLAKT